MNADGWVVYLRALRTKERSRWERLSSRIEEGVM